MPVCKNCWKRYRGEEPYCEGCEEFNRQVAWEENVIVCQCGQQFMPAGFEQHKWRCYYRDGQFHRGKKRSKWW